MSPELRQMHDQALKANPDPEAAEILRGRGEAARAIRLTLARMFGRQGIATHSQWHILPCVTSTGTIGVVDVARGIAWDSGVQAPATVADLGLEAEVYAAANGVGGDVRIDGELVQRDGATPGKPPKMPDGWQQIALPTWRGYTPGAGYDEVPVSEYKPGEQIRPALSAWGLTTCYGTPGAEPANAPDGAPALCETHGHGYLYPWGVPAWVIGVSVSVVDTLIETVSIMEAGRPSRSRLARSSEEAERQMADRMLAIARVETARRLRAWADSGQHDSYAAANRAAADRAEEVEAFRDAAAEFDSGVPASSIYQAARRAVSRGSNRMYSPEPVHLDSLVLAERAMNAWEVARALGNTYGMAILREFGLTSDSPPVDGRELAARCRPAIEAALVRLEGGEVLAEYLSSWPKYSAELIDHTRLGMVALDVLLAVDPIDDDAVATELGRIVNRLYHFVDPAHQSWVGIRIEDEIRQLRVERFVAAGRSPRIVS